MIPAESFLTGSRAYGTPRDDSDVDFACLCGDMHALSELARFADQCGGSPNGRDGVTLMFGKLNLLIFADPRAFEAWKIATSSLQSRAPQSRDEAILEIDKELTKAIPGPAGTRGVPF